MKTRALLILAALLAGAAAVDVSADEKMGRGRVKDFAFQFTPAGGRAPVPPLTVSVLPPINDNDLERHSKNVQKAFRNMAPAEYPRVLGIRYNGYGKPLNRFLTPEPFETIIQRALEQELTALGLMLVGPSLDNPPDDFRRKTVSAIAGRFSSPKPDVLVTVTIDDFFFETTAGFTKMKMETFFELEVGVFSLAEDDFIWEGRVEAGELEKKAMFMGKEAVQNRLNASFQMLIEAVLRNNKELLVELEKL